jgi:hypothetical protein
MTFHDDPEDRDLERRIRSIADSPQPPVPGSVLRYAGEVTRQKRGFKMRFSPGFPFGRGPARLGSALGVAATLVVAVALAGVLISQRSHQTGPSSSSSPTTSAVGSTKPTSSASVALATQTPHESIPVGTPGPTLTNAGFDAPGLPTGWQGFSWTKLGASNPMIANPDLAGSGVAQVLKWQGGYAAIGSTPGSAGRPAGLWLSPDGQTWSPAKTMPAEPRVMVAAAGAGLVVMGIDALGTAKSVDTTPDGISWNGTDVSNLPGSVVSIAGTSTGIVATVAVNTGTGKFALTDYLVEFSTDGANWSPETIQPGLSWNPNSSAPTVESNAGRFFLLGSTTSPLAQVGGTGIVFASSAAAPSYVWWSDDGRTWTRSGGSFQAAPQRIDFGRDGMLLETSWNAVPGGTELARSTDGGKTWAPDAKFGPLGPSTCSGACGTGPDGAIGSNGTYFVAVKNGGKQAWTSFDGASWTPISWAGPDPATVGLGSFFVLPRGVLAGDMYGAAK